MRADANRRDPQSDRKARLKDLARALKTTCETAILTGNLAEGETVVEKPVEVLVLAVIEPSLSLQALAQKLSTIASHVESGEKIRIHYTIGTFSDFICFLHAKHGVWPNAFVKAAQGMVLRQFRHDGEFLFEVVQRTLSYSDQKIQELLKSGTLAKRRNGRLYFTDLGARRFVRLAKPPVMQEVNERISFLGHPEFDAS